MSETRTSATSTTYAGDRRVVDADSHLMEWPTYLTDHADANVRDQLPSLAATLSSLQPVGGGHSEDEREALLALGGDLLRRGPKWYAALGSVDPGERTEALDRLGFEHQVVYSSLCAPLFSIRDAEVRYGGYRAHNRAMAGFCGSDQRLHGVAICDLDDPDRSPAELRAALDLGAGLIWIPARAPAGCSPGHPMHDWFWATLEERGVPFVLHVGSGALPIDPEWMDDGREAEARMVGAEIIGSKDFMVVYQPVARFLSVLVLDGVLERHPGLRGGAIEMGAGWVPDVLRRLDHAAAIWSRSETRLRTFQRKPSEQAAAQLRFTPYPFEDVGLLGKESDPSLYVFSSDYPHAEGGHDPIGRFDRSLALAEAGEGVIDGFFSANASEWLGLAGTTTSN